MKFSWLHLSDLHFGMSGQSWLWPTLKHAFLDDIRQLHARVGSWDVVLFTGDLTQRGVETEFRALNEALEEIWDVFGSLGFRPPLFLIPGNHDLRRPDALKPEALVLDQWWQRQQVRENFWEKDQSPYRQEVHEAFEAYETWLAHILPKSVPLLPRTQGQLPGDCSAVLAKDGGTLGLVGLNSAWLQLGAGDYKGRLHIDPRQLMAVTDGDPVAWCRSCTASLLLTHHPASWLHPESLQYWNSDINPSGRFSSHLFGHMHEPASTSVALGGSPVRRALQAASLFGLEEFSGQLKRIHGYSVGALERQEQQLSLKIWPRRARAVASGAMRLGPDVSFDLNVDNYIQEEVALYGQSASVHADKIQLPTNLSTSSAVATHALSTAHLLLRPAPAHTRVRRIERQALETSLGRSRAAWLVSDWGMGADGLLWSVKTALGDDGLDVFRIDAHSYTERSKFMAAITLQIGCGLEQLCNLLAEKGAAYLVLDDLPIGSGDSEGDRALERDIDDLARTILQYCPDLKLLLRSRLPPRVEDFGVVELSALDEADTKNYVGGHVERFPALANPGGIAQLFRLTDGVPARIDIALRDLEFLSLQELLANHREVESDLPDEAVPNALVHALQGLREPENPTANRAFELLKVLAIFPQGEQLSRIRRFHGAHGFFPVHVRELIDRGLVDAVAPPRIGAAAAEDASKTLVERRPVRDYLRSQLTETEIETLNRQAVALYFGESWSNGSYRTPPQFRFDDPARDESELLNASSILVRLLRVAVEAGDSRKIREALNVSSFYCASLKHGDHFRGIVSFCEDLLPLIPAEFSTEEANFKANYAESLRMVGSRSAAKSILLELRNLELPKAARQSILVDLALCHKDDKELEEAKLAAKEAAELVKGNGLAMQADAILLHIEDAPGKNESLLRLEQQARRKKSITVANNLALDRIDSPSINPAAAELILKEVIASSESKKDYYNMARGVVRLAKLRLDTGRTLSFAEQVGLIDSYHYLYGQRIGGLFSNCHRVLWQVFEQAGDTPNLLRLFRHSSLIWRLRGLEKIERQYMARLMKRVNAGTGASTSLAKETSYLLARVGDLGLPSVEGGQRDPHTGSADDALETSSNFD